MTRQGLLLWTVDSFALEYSATAAIWQDRDSITGKCYLQSLYAPLEAIPAVKFLRRNVSHPTAIQQEPAATQKIEPQSESIQAAQGLSVG
ncbi:MAG: hypothetical protein ACLP00_28230 [Terracidiphilus sp.]